MPRKRATRAQTTHAKPRLKAFDDGDSVHEMTQAMKKEKLDNLITDFKYNIENIRKQYEEVTKAGENEIDKQFHHMRCKLSPAELKMTVKEYLEYTMAEETEEHDNVDVLPTRPALQLPSSMSKNIAQTLNKYRSQRMIDTIPEDDASTDTATVKRATRKKRGTNTNTVTFNAGPSSTAPPNSFVTPAMQRNISEFAWGATPLVTPKFDPRLPVTPANSRRWRHGEVAMSLAGSPLTMQTEDSEKENKLIWQGEEVQIPDNVTDIKSLMSTLKSIMDKNKDQS